jgi:hypothetical protein
MMKSRSVSQAALVIKWPQAIATAAPGEVARRLSAGRVPATWSVEHARQVEMLKSWGAAGDDGDAILLASSRDQSALQAGDSMAGHLVAKCLQSLRAQGLRVEAIHGGADMVDGSWPRTLRAMGVRGIVIEGAAVAGVARALPFGLWQFTPLATAPRVRRWTNLFRRQPTLFDGGLGRPALVTIDLARVGEPGSSAWREMEAALGKAAEARSAGSIALVTIGELIDQFSQAATPRPQRSILRAA